MLGGSLKVYVSPSLYICISSKSLNALKSKVAWAVLSRCLKPPHLFKLVTEFWLADPVSPPIQPFPTAFSVIILFSISLVTVAKYPLFPKYSNCLESEKASFILLFLSLYKFWLALGVSAALAGNS